MPGPIKPNEVGALKVKSIPEEVFEAFNELIIENYSGNKATVKQDDVVSLAVKKLSEGCLSTESKQKIRNMIYDKHWLDVEPAYREAGWLVDYDKPGFNESYPATFEFKKSG